MGFTAFQGHARIASGGLGDVAVAASQAAPEAGPVLIFDDETGRVRDIDPRGTEAQIRARLEPPPPDETPGPDEMPRGPGRPKLGVVAREVTLLPRHWEWLAAQSGGASVALRKLVEAARTRPDPATLQRQGREAVYRFASAMAGNAPDFEEAARALFAGDRAEFERRIASWPPAIREQIEKMAPAAFAP